MFLFTVLLFCIFCVALRINQIMQQHYEERKKRTDAINAIIYEYYHDHDDDYDYDYAHAILESLDEITDTEEIDRTSNVISFLKEKNSRKYWK